MRTPVEHLKGINSCHNSCQKTFIFLHFGAFKRHLPAPKIRVIFARDAQAALILRLMECGPLVMVTFSGSASLHAWFYCQGESEEVGSPLHQFMSDVATLGADTQLFTASQFARMPMGRRAIGEEQTVHYLNFNSIPRR
jgi:hypothetical protein